MMNHKTLTKLRQKKYRNQYNLFLVEGKKSVAEAFAKGAEVTQVCVSKNFVQFEKNFVNMLAQKKFNPNDLTVLDEYALSKLSSSTTPSGIVAVVKKPQTNTKQLVNESLIPILEDIRDPGNMGTMIRTAEWFGIKSMILIGGADVYQPKVVQASMGSIFSLNIIQTPTANQLIEDLKNQGFKLVVTRPESSKAKKSTYESKDKLAIVFGNESQGTTDWMDKQADSYWSLASFGSAESLNVAVSFGICMYEFKV